MRTSYKTSAYFDQLLAQAQQKASHEKASQQTALAGRELVVPGFELTLSTNLILQLFIRYSRGDSLPAIAGLYPEIADRFLKSWNPRNVLYTHLFDVLTLGVLLEAPAETFARIGQLVDQARLRDYLVDYFLNWRQPRPLHPTLRWQGQRAYNGLRQLTELSPPAAQAQMPTYLAKDWYTKANTYISYNSHLATDNSFSGYWSFGAGAVSKIMHLDDAAWATSEYYPYDLVHWQA
ncbi:MAG: DUF1911 domain-containing protein [Hymenobacter sp.]|nr:MAG: DUF1911 domain-containing protein [Hymenobacter sp.]